LKSIANQTTTSARDWKSKTRISNKQTTRIHKGIIEAKVSNSRSKTKANKFSTLSNRAVVSKDRRHRRQEHKTQLKGPTKGREMAKAKTGTETRNRDSENSTASSTEKKRGMSPEIAQMPKRRRKESKVDPTLSLRHSSRQER
jgi:hypothetical protein